MDGVGGLCDFGVTPVPIGLGFGFGTALGLGLGLRGPDLGLGLDNNVGNWKFTDPLPKFFSKMCFRLLRVILLIHLVFVFVFW